MARNYLNLSLRSIFHLFVSGSLFYFFSSHFNISLVFGTLGALLIGTLNEAFEYIRQIENSFHQRETFIRDRLLAGLSVVYTAIIVKLSLVLATLFAPLSLMFLTSYIDKKADSSSKTGERNLIKPAFDILSIATGPLACVLLLHFVHK